jgi:serine/threonine protein kinase
LALLEGESLKERLSLGPLPLDELIRVGEQIAGAIHAAHRHGIVHRDLKPGNIMLTRSGAKLLDFGLARSSPVLDVADSSVSPTVSRDLTREGAVVGTLQYMPPEQLEGRDADARTDILALGLVLYEMAAGRHPFENRATASLIAAIVKEEPRSLKEIARSTPPALDRIVSTCLAKDPDDRWQSARDVQILLTTMEHPGAAAGTSPGQGTKRRPRRLLAWGGALLLLLGAGLLAVRSVRVIGPTPLEGGKQRSGTRSPE